MNLGIEGIVETVDIVIELICTNGTIDVGNGTMRIVASYTLTQQDSQVEIVALTLLNCLHVRLSGLQIL